MLRVSLLKTETAVEPEVAKGGVGLGDWEQVKEWLAQDPALVKKYREECEVVYLGFPPLSAQNGSLQENNLLGGQTPITAR